jgi:DNA-binding transcriptional LysR family regulator
MINSAAFPPELLASFVMVAQSRSFTEAGRRLSLGQSTVSQHIRRLEGMTGHRLFQRDTHSVSLTEDGQAMLIFAQTILDAQDRARRYFAGSELRGRLRFGASEDFVLGRLPDILGNFTRRHPSVDLELTVALSGKLHEMLDDGELDLVLAKRRLGDHNGDFVSRERLVWIGTDPNRLAETGPLPLVMFQPPSITRAMAIETLDKAGVPWRVVCTCSGLLGLRAATLAGLGVMVQPSSLVPPGLIALPPAANRPALEEIEFVLIGRHRTLQGPARELAETIKQDHRMGGGAPLF